MQHVCVMCIYYIQQCTIPTFESGDVVHSAVWAGGNVKTACVRPTRATTIGTGVAFFSPHRFFCLPGSPLSPLGLHSHFGDSWGEIHWNES